MKTTENDLISVLMPVYNVEKYVAEAVESILNQTYKNLEFIIVDDCSTDGTYEICQSYAEKDGRIRLFRNVRNLKISKTLNFALTKVTGKFVARMDGDDISVPNRLEVMKEYLDENTEIRLVGTGAITINEKGEEIGRTTFLDDFNLIKKTCTLKTPVVHIWMTYKDVYERLNGYRLVNPTEDYDFVLRCISSGFKVSNISDFMDSGYDRTMNPPCLSGCFMFMRTSALQEIEQNGEFFDGRFFMYFEDFDLIRRLHKVGKTMYFPAVEIVHDHAAESYKSCKMLMAHIKSAFRYFNKWGWIFDRERREWNKKILKEMGIKKL